MSEALSVEDLKNQIVANQKMIDQLNADLVRKAQEVKIFQEISMEINNSLDLDVILGKMLVSLDKTFEFRHSMVLLVDEQEESLHVAASYGYNDQGIGAKVKFGEGIIGVVAKRKKMMRMGNVGTQRAYLNSVRSNMSNAGEEVKNLIKLPGLDNVQSQVAIPLLLDNELVGVLAVESAKPNLFDTRDELIITIIANQAASAIEKAAAHQKLKHINENLEHLVEQRTAEVVQQKDIIEKKNKDITDSIRYALRLQNALLPNPDYVRSVLPDSFIFFKAKDIVSGDFYWVNKKNNKVYFAVVDCTGHGVPGAMMSIIAHSNLQRALILFGLQAPSEILDFMAEAVEELLSRQHGGEIDTGIRDGMDIALCSIDLDKMELQYAGAYNSLYFVRNGELTEYKADKQPIGHYEFRKKFTNHVIDLKKNDCIYLFSDGYIDQFGGQKGKKFKSAQFKELLINNSSVSMSDQREIIASAFKTWKGSVSQTDDVCVMGVKI